ncbi:hypothetical protein E1091_14550, partial [Micromonospora fluostatini]
MAVIVEVVVEDQARTLVDPRDVRGEVLRRRRAEGRAQSSGQRLHGSRHGRTSHPAGPDPAIGADVDVTVFEERVAPEKAGRHDVLGVLAFAVVRLCPSLDVRQDDQVAGDIGTTEITPDD